MITDLEKAICLVKIGDRLTEDMPGFLLERQNEVDLCKNRDIPYFLINVLPFEQPSQANTKIMQMVKRGTWYLPQPITSLERYNIFLRSWLAHTPYALDAIRNLKGHNELDEDSLQIVFNWPMHVSREYTNRDISLLTLSQLKSSAEHYAKDGLVFVKTREKPGSGHGHGVIMTIDQALQAETLGLPYCDSWVNKRRLQKLDGQSTLIVSQPMDLARDELGTVEYRGWVFNQNLVAISRYAHPENTNVPPAVVSFAEQFSKAHNSRLPRHYVLDLCQTTNGKVCVVEINDIMSAGNTNKLIFGKILDAYFTNGN